MDLSGNIKSLNYLIFRGKQRISRFIADNWEFCGRLWKNENARVRTHFDFLPCKEFNSSYLESSCYFI